MKTITLGAELVTTGRGVDQWEHPLSGSLLTRGWKAARVTLESFYIDAGNMSVQAYYEVSDDGKTWSDHTPLGSALTADGVTVSSGGTDGFLSLANARGKRFLRFGVDAVNSVADNTIRSAYVALRVESRNF